MKIEKILSVMTAGILAACSIKTASIKVPEPLENSTVYQLITQSEYWGLGMDGIFDLAGLYTGKYQRSASSSSYFDDFVTNKEGTMLAEVINSKTGVSWILSCHGGGTGVNIGNFSFGGDDPYVCEITNRSGNIVGSYSLTKSGGVIDFGPSGKVNGTLTLSEKTYEIESIHEMEGSFIPVDHPLGYYIKSQGKVVAAVQVNGRITLQSDDNDLDSYAIATVASALSVRPEE